MVESDSLPILGRMATVALLPQFTLVLILLFMAFNAGLGCGFQCGSCMTLQAIRFLMLSD